MSDTRIGVPFRVETTMSLKSAAASTRPSVRSSSWPLPCSTVPLRVLDVSATMRVAHLGHRQAVRVELFDVDDDVDLAGAASRRGLTLADAVDRSGMARAICFSVSAGASAGSAR
jgi:hypothetical protein